MLDFFYHCLRMDKDDQEFVSESLNELTGFLQQEPTEVNIRVSKLPEQKADRVEAILKQYTGERRLAFDEYYAKVCEVVGRIRINKLLIYCQPKDAIAEAAFAKNGDAIWGIAYGGPEPDMSVVYRGDTKNKEDKKYILWHEFLHLLGAGDCHQGKKNPGPTCGLSCCIMQWEPTKEKVKVYEWPFICSGNIKNIRSCYNKMENNKKRYD